MCGKVIGYQFASTDGAAALHFSSRSINGPYIDGVSLTHGSRRQHIWSFIAALSEEAQYSNYACYCTNRNSRGPLPPSFVGQDYFCDSGNHHWPGGNRFFDIHFGMVLGVVQTVIVAPFTILRGSIRE